MEDEVSIQRKMEACLVDGLEKINESKHSKIQKLRYWIKNFIFGNFR